MGRIGHEAIPVKRKRWLIPYSFRRHCDCSATGLSSDVSLTEQSVFMGRSDHAS